LPTRDRLRQVAVAAGLAGAALATIAVLLTEALRSVTPWSSVLPAAAVVALVAIAAWRIGARAFRERAAAMDRLQEALDAAQRAEAEKNRLLAELSAAHDAVEEIIRGAPLAIAKVDRDYRVELWNPAAETLFGFRSADVLGKPMPTIPGDERSQLRDLVIRPLERGEKVVGIELERLRADGTTIHILMSATALRGPDGSIRHIVGFMLDLEARRSVEAQLLQAQKMEAVGRLAGGVAHDFNNLLTVIKSSCDFVLAQIEPGSAVHEDVEQIEQAADRAAGLTRQLLAFSRRQVAQPQPLDLAEVVEGAQKMLRRLIGEDVALETDLPKGEAIVEADPGLVEQVLMNLAVNARDAMPRGGVLRLGVGDLQTCPAQCKVAPERCTGRCARLTVEDTGSGMDERTLQRIFEPFFTTKQPGVGTGLGLSTVYGIVEQAHGFVDVKSRPGKGTRFDVILPCIATGSLLAAKPEERELARGAGDVLVVEDEQPVRKLAVRVLRACGYTVHEAADASAALELAARLPALDLVLSDVVMPGMAGPALVQELQRRRPGLRYLLMSGYTSDELERHRAVATRVPLLEKPFSPKELAARVHDLLDPGAPVRLAQVS